MKRVKTVGVGRLNGQPENRFRSGFASGRLPAFPATSTTTPSRASESASPATALEHRLDMSQEVLVALKKLLPSNLPAALAKRPGTLYHVLSRYPRDGVGQKVHQLRWTTKGLADCYWQVTRTRLKLEGKHGVAWGKLFWKGALLRVSARASPRRNAHVSMLQANW